MNKQGTIVRWDAQRGFGFLRSASTESDVFFHVRDFRGRGMQPAEGLQVDYEEIHVGGRGPRAMAIQPLAVAGTREPAQHETPRSLSEPRRSKTRAPGASAEIAAMLLLIPAYAALFLWAAWTQRIAVPVLLGMPLISVVAFYFYWRDKFAAQRGAWRTPEASLHAISLVGGWPGAWLAQRLLRHKSSKASFRAVYWGTVALHWIVLLGWLATTPGR
jgi:uncharacterized membrane protein YsdA (DUF1294 family)/cold shock CspA family protein